MFATLRSVTRMKRALRKSERGNGPRLSIAVEIEEEEDYMSTFMWYGGNCVFCLSIYISFCQKCESRELNGVSAALTFK